MEDFAAHKFYAQNIYTRQNAIILFARQCGFLTQNVREILWAIEEVKSDSSRMRPGKICCEIASE
jgi:hypothetical protein